MDTFDAIKARRSVKHYDPDHTISDDEQRQLFEMAVLSPTSFNIQNWRFVNVCDTALRQQVRDAAWGQAHISEASMLVVICADLRAWGKSPERYWRDAPEAVGEIMVPMIGPFYEGKDQLQRDEAMRSAGIAAQTLMLSAKAMGYDSCPMIGFDTDKVAELLNLPVDHTVCMVVVIGKALKPANPRGGQLPMDEVVITDRYSG